MGVPRPHPPWPWWRRHGPVLGLTGSASVALVLVVALGPAVGGVTGYRGPFESAAFHEDGLDAARSAGGPPDVFGSAGVAVLYADLESGDATWVVYDDGRVVVTGDAAWPEARDAFAAWYAGLGLGSPRFGGLRVVTPTGDLDDRALLLS